mmetsp:Transcript_21712/g.52481  ORF Transcript_21712/g.52481 Transcript_21712/m.52481 type:complete len:97 (+) Transcript_21712:1956-2246(+)
MDGQYGGRIFSEWISGKPQQSSANASSASSERCVWCRLSSHATIGSGCSASVSAGSAGRNESVFSDGNIPANHKCTEEMMMPACYNIMAGIGIADK